MKRTEKDLESPCLKMKCEFGSICMDRVKSTDQIRIVVAECVCPEKCSHYLDDMDGITSGAGVISSQKRIATSSSSSSNGIKEKNNNHVDETNGNSDDDDDVVMRETKNKIEADDNSPDSHLWSVPQSEESLCGSDGRDYRNYCELKLTSCRDKRHIQVKYRGSCGESSDDTFFPPLFFSALFFRPFHYPVRTDVR